MAINKNELNQYQKFVDKVTSDASKNTEKLVDRLEYVDRKNIHVSRILTAGIGLSGEVGEFNEIIKKALFQEKELDDQTVTHLKKELGDIMWYVAQACISLNTDIEEIIGINMTKLKSRYDKGSFDKDKSNIRKEEDI